MSFFTMTGLRRRLLVLATFAAVSALSAAPAFADHEYRGGGFWFPPIPRIFVPFPPPFVVVAQPYGHHCDYDEHRYYYDDDHSYYYDDGYGRGYRGDYYRQEWRRRGHDRHFGHGHHGHGGHDDD
jgi:hypothetical protein